MSSAGLATFDGTLQKTNIWLDDILHELRCDLPERAYQALGAILHTLRDHPTIDETVHWQRNSGNSSAECITKAGNKPCRRRNALNVRHLIWKM